MTPVLDICTGGPRICLSGPSSGPVVRARLFSVVSETDRAKFRSLSLVSNWTIMAELAKPPDSALKAGVKSFLAGGAGGMSLVFVGTSTPARPLPPEPACPGRVLRPPGGTENPSWPPSPHRAPTAPAP